MLNELDHIISKARGYCAQQERCISDMKEKLYEWKCPAEKMDTVISELTREGFLDELRYAKAFASGKFRINHWGKTKIRYEMERRKIPADVISAGLEEIDELEYEKTLEDLLNRKRREIKEKDPYRRKQKLIAFAVQKGFDYETIRRTLERTD